MGLDFPEHHFTNIVPLFFWGWTDRLFMGRFYFSATPYLIILVTRGLLCLAQMLCVDPDAGHPVLEIERPAHALFLVVLFIIISMPVRAADLNPQYNIPHLQVDRRLCQAVKQQQIHNAVVFIEPQDRNELIVGSGFFMNTPDLESQDIIYAKDLGKKIRDCQTIPQKKRIYIPAPQTDNKNS